MKTLKIKPEIHKDLDTYRARKGLKTFNDAIENLLEGKK